MHNRSVCSSHKYLWTLFSSIPLPNFQDMIYYHFLLHSYLLFELTHENLNHLLNRDCFQALISITYTIFEILSDTISQYMQGICPLNKEASFFIVPLFIDFEWDFAGVFAIFRANLYAKLFLTGRVSQII